MRAVGLVILPALRQPVQTLTRLVDPLTTARTRWMLGFQRRLVRRWEWLTAIPKPGFFEQISQTEDISASQDVGQADAQEHSAVTCHGSSRIAVPPKQGRWSFDPSSKGGVVVDVPLRLGSRRGQPAQPPR